MTYGIPLKLSHTVVDIKGKERVEGVTLAQVGADKENRFRERRKNMPVILCFFQ